MLYFLCLGGAVLRLKENRPRSRWSRINDLRDVKLVMDCFKCRPNKHTMRACLFIWILLEQTLASRDFHYIQRLEGESVDIFCVAQASKPHPSLLYLRQIFAHSESVLNISEDGMRAGPDIEGRIKISGQPNVLQTAEITVTLSDLRRTDTGLYVCDFSGNPSDQLSEKTALFLLVNAADDPCSCRMYSLLIYTISGGASLLLLTVIALFFTHKKPNVQQEHQTTVPIYEDMSSVQGSIANHHRICPPQPETSARGWTKANKDYAGKTIDPKRTDHVTSKREESKCAAFNVIF